MGDLKRKLRHSAAEVDDILDEVEELAERTVPHVFCTQAEYDDIEEPDEGTLYVIVG